MMISVKKINRYLFFIAYFLFLAFSFLGHISVVGGYLKLLTNFSLLLLAFSIVLQIKTYTLKEILWLGILSFISIFIIIETGEYLFLKLTLLLMASKGIEFDRCIRFDFYIRILLIALVFLLYFLNIAPDVVSYYDGGFRHSLGFTNPNTFGMHFLIFSLEFIYICQQRKVPIKKMLFILLIFLFVDYYSGSRTTSFVLLFFLLLLLVNRFCPNFWYKPVVKFVICHSAFLFFLFTMIATIFYSRNNTFMIQVNDVLSNRLYNILFFAKHYSLTLFGNPISEMNLTLDSTYAFLLYGLGVVPLILFLVSFQRLQFFLYQHQQTLLLIIMFCFAFYGLSEKLWIFVDYNVFMLAFRYILYSSKE